MRQFLIFITALGIFLSLDTFAQLKPAQSQYLQEKGGLINPSFEQGYKGWTISGDCTKSLESDVPLLNKTLKLTCVNQSFSVKQNADYSAFDGQQGLLEAQVKASVGNDVFIRSLANGFEATNASIIAGDYKSVFIPIVMDGTSNGLEYYSNGNVTGDFYIDEVSLRLEANLTKQVEAFDTDWIAFEGSGTWTSNTSYNGFYRREGDSAHIKIEVALSGAPNATQLYVDLPNSLTIDTNKVNNTVNQVEPFGYARYLDAGFALAMGQVAYGNANTNVRVLLERIVGNNDTATTSNTTPITFANGDRIYLEFTVPIEGWATGRNTVTAQATELTAQTANELSAKIDISGNITSENYDFIDGNCTIPTTGRYECDFVSNIFSNIPSCTVSANTSSSDIVTTIEETLTGFEIRVRSNGNSVINRPINIHCSRQGADVNKSQTIIGKFEQIEEVKTPLDKFTANTLTVNLSNNGTITINEENIPNWYDSITRLSTGVVQINYASLGLSSIPTLTAIVANQQTRIANVESLSATSAVVRVRNVSNVNDDRDLHITLTKNSPDFNTSQVGAIIQSAESSQEIADIVREDIVSTALCQVDANGNSNQGITGSVTNIPFTLNEPKDNCSAFDGTTYTAQKNGFLQISGMVRFNAGVSTNIEIFKNGTFFKSLSSDLSQANHPYAGVIEVVVGDLITLRSSASGTLSNSNIGLHHIAISELPDTASVLENLVADNISKCQTKFLSSNITADTTDIADLRFNNLSIGKRYELTYQGDVSVGSATFGGRLSFLHNGNIISNFFLIGDNTHRMTAGNTTRFNATATTVTANFDEINIATLFGNGTKAQTFVELCELPTTVIETTDFN